MRGQAGFVMSQHHNKGNSTLPVEYTPLSRGRTKQAGGYPPAERRFIQVSINGTVGRPAPFTGVFLWKENAHIMLHRFSRLELLVGDHGLTTLAAKHVAVFGLGGVGGHAAEALARSGVGQLTLVDYDDVCLTNMNRQLVALHSTVGRDKVDVMVERINDINPHCRVHAVKEFYTADNGHAMLQGPFDFVLDAIDTVSAKLDLIQRCLERQIPIISCMGAGNKWDPTQLTVCDIAETHTCPLAKIVRLQLRKAGWVQGLPVVFSPEQPAPIVTTAGSCHGGCVCPDPGSKPFNCTQRRSIPGSTAFVPPAAGLAMASYAVRRLLEH